jgi:hypothetical protein
MPLLPRGGNGKPIAAFLWKDKRKMSKAANILHFFQMLFKIAPGKVMMTSQKERETFVN